MFFQLERSVSLKQSYEKQEVKNVRVKDVRNGYQREKISELKRRKNVREKKCQEGRMTG